VRTVSRIARGAIVVACVLVWIAGLLQERFDWHWLEWIDTVLSHQCHRIPERTLTLFGAPMAVCSRCAGLYLGIALGALLAWPRLSGRATARVSLFALGLLIVEVALEALGWLPPLHVVRLALGLAFSWPITAAAAHHLPLLARTKRP
jgi:hypothetical protein